VLNSFVEACTSKNLVAFSVGLDSGTNLLDQREKPVANVLRVVITNDAGTELKEATGLFHLDDASVNAKGRHFALRFRLLLARLCGHDGNSCDCHVPTQEEFDKGFGTASDASDVEDSHVSNVSADSDDEYWRKEKENEEEGDFGDDAEARHDRYSTRRAHHNRLKRLVAEAEGCSHYQRHIDHVLGHFLATNTDGASDMRYNPKANPTCLRFPPCRSGKDSKAAMARVQRWCMRRGKEAPHCAFRCPSHILNLAMGDPLRRLYPPEQTGVTPMHPLFQIAKLVAVLRKDGVAMAMLGNMATDLYKSGAFDDEIGPYKLWQVLKFQSYIKIRWSSLYKMLLPLHRAAPHFFKLQAQHDAERGALPVSLRKLLFPTTDTENALWSLSNYAIICNLLDVFDPTCVNALPDGDGDGEADDHLLMGFNGLTRRFQTRHGAPIVHAVKWIDGFLHNSRETWPYHDDHEEEVAIGVDSDGECDEITVEVDVDFEFDANSAGEPLGERVERFKEEYADQLQAQEADGGESWDDMWPGLSEFAVRLRRSVVHRFKHIRPFYEMCALVHPSNHTDEPLNVDDERVEIANKFGRQFGLSGTKGGRALRELRHRLRGPEKLTADDHDILKQQGGLMRWYNHKATHGWTVTQGVEKDMFVFAGNILALLFTNAITESELSIQNALTGGKGGKGGNMSLSNRHNLGTLRAAPSALDHARAGQPISWERNMLFDKPPPTKHG